MLYRVAAKATDLEATGRWQAHTDTQCSQIGPCSAMREDRRDALNPCLHLAIAKPQHDASVHEILFTLHSELPAIHPAASHGCTQVFCVMQYRALLQRPWMRAPQLGVAPAAELAREAAFSCRQLSTI